MKIPGNKWNFDAEESSFSVGNFSSANACIVTSFH